MGLYDRRVAAVKRADFQKSFFFNALVGTRLREALEVVRTPFARALVLEADHPDILAQLAASGKILHMECLTSFEMEAPAAGGKLQRPYACLLGGGVGLHRFADKTALGRFCFSLLEQGGYFLAALPSEGTLGEFREALGRAEASETAAQAARILSFDSLGHLGESFVAAGFQGVVCTQESVCVFYGSLEKLRADLKAAGENGLLFSSAVPPLRRAVWEKTKQYYGAHFRDAAGGFIVTLNIAFISGWRP